MATPYYVLSRNAELKQKLAELIAVHTCLQIRQTGRHLTAMPLQECLDYNNVVHFSETCNCKISKTKYLHDVIPVGAAMVTHWDWRQQHQESYVVVRHIESVESKELNPALDRIVAGTESAMCTGSTMQSYAEHAILCIMGNQHTLEYICQQRADLFQHYVEHGTELPFDVAHTVVCCQLTIPCLEKMLAKLEKKFPGLQHSFSLKFLIQKLGKPNSLITSFAKLKFGILLQVQSLSGKNNKRSEVCGLAIEKRNYGEHSIDTALRGTREEMLLNFVKADFYVNPLVKKQEQVWQGLRVLTIALPDLSHLLIQPPRSECSCIKFADTDTHPCLQIGIADYNADAILVNPPRRGMISPATGIIGE